MFLGPLVEGHLEKSSCYLGPLALKMVDRFSHIFFIPLFLLMTFTHMLIQTTSLVSLCPPSQRKITDTYCGIKYGQLY